MTTRSTESEALNRMRGGRSHRILEFRGRTGSIGSIQGPYRASSSEITQFIASPPGSITSVWSWLEES